MMEVIMEENTILTELKEWKEWGELFVVNTDPTVVNTIIGKINEIIKLDFASCPEKKVSEFKGYLHSLVIRIRHKNGIYPNESDCCVEKEGLPLGKVVNGSSLDWIGCPVCGSIHPEDSYPKKMG